MITDKQQNDWQALVDYLSTKGNGACLNSLLEDGSDDTTDFAGLLRDFKAKDKSVTITIYDPPSGWRYGFPKQYLPKPGETLEDIPDLTRKPIR